MAKRDTLDLTPRGKFSALLRYICSTTIIIFEKIILQKLPFIECKIVVKLPRISAATIQAIFGENLHSYFLILNLHLLRDFENLKFTFILREFLILDLHSY